MTDPVTLEIDFDAHGVMARGTTVPLTRAELAILAALASQPLRVWSRTELLQRALGRNLRAYERNIDGHVKNLRRKLKAQFPAASPIRSIYGMGYRLQVPALVRQRPRAGDPHAARSSRAAPPRECGEFVRSRDHP